MNLKGFREFLKPAAGKVILFLALFILSFFLLPAHYFGGPSQYGFPLTFFQFEGCYGPPGATPLFCWETTVNSFPNLIFDILIWYVFSCLVIGVYKKYLVKK